jgi:hypothetical protein
MEVATMSANKWLDAIKNNLHAKLDEVEDGFASSRDLQKIWNLSLSHTVAKIALLKINGHIIEKNFRIKTGRKIYPVPHYKLK